MAFAVQDREAGEKRPQPFACLRDEPNARHDECRAMFVEAAHETLVDGRQRRSVLPRRAGRSAVADATSRQKFPPAAFQAEKTGVWRVF
jgi:hypothetical protein